MPVLWQRATRGESLVAPAGAAPASGPGGSEPPRPPFAGLRGGVGRLPELVAGELARRGATLRTGAVVRELSRTDRGWRLVVGSAADPQVVEADAVIVCLPAAPAARLLAPHAPTAAAALGGVETASSAVVTLAVEKVGLEHLPGRASSCRRSRDAPSRRAPSASASGPGPVSSPATSRTCGPPSAGPARRPTCSATTPTSWPSRSPRSARPWAARCPASSTPTCSAGAAGCRSTPSATSTGSPPSVPTSRACPASRWRARSTTASASLPWSPPPRPPPPPPCGT